MKYKTTIKIDDMIINIDYQHPSDLEKLTDYFEEESVDHEIDQLKSAIDKSQKSIKEISSIIGISTSEISRLKNKYGLIDRINFITEKIKTEIIK